MSHFAYFLRFFVFFFGFPHVIFGLQLVEYPSAYIYSFFPKKIQNLGVSGGMRGYANTILSHFHLFSEIFDFFFSFSHSNHDIFGLQLVLSMLMHMFTVVAL